MDKYIMYLRKSQMDRDFEEISVEETLQRHKKILTDFAIKNNLNVTVILEEVVSGEALSARPKMQQCLELVNTGEFSGVICMDHDRLSRGSGFDSGYITQIFQINHCKIVTPSKTFDLSNDSDEQFSDMKFMFSRYELKTITKRLVRGREQSASEGKFLGSVPPFGYEIYKLKGEKGNSLKIVPEQAKIVQLIFDLYTEKNMGYETIQHELNNVLHIPSFSGTWSKTSVVNIINNITYCGKIRWGFQTQTKNIVNGTLKKSRKKNHDYKIYDGLHEAIISDEQFQKALAIRNSYSHPSVVINRTLQNPFASLMYCKKCRKPIKRNIDKARSNVLPWFRCPSRTCDCRTTKCHTIENAIVNQMQTWLADYEITIANDHQEFIDDSIPAAIEVIENELASLECQQNKICELLEKSVYSIEMFQKRNESLSLKIEKLTSDREDLISRLAEQQSKENTTNNIIPIAHQLLDNYEHLNSAEKNALWLQVLERIEYYRSPNSETFEIELFPKIPH